MNVAESAPLVGAKAMSPYEVSGYTYGMNGGHRTQSCSDCETRWVGADGTTCFLCEAAGQPVFPSVL